ATLPRVAPFAPDWILVHCNTFFVGENVVHLRSHVPQIISCDQWRGQNRPQAEMGTVLRRGHPTITDLEHVRIIPMSWAGVGLQTNLLVQNRHHAVGATATVLPLLLAAPAVLDVASRAPQVATGFLAPQPRLRLAPLANA